MEAYERGGFSAYDDQKIQSYLTSLSNIRYRYIIYVYLLSLRPSLTCIFHKTSICSAYIRLIFEVYRCKLLSANKNFKRRQFFLELQFPLFYRVSLHSLLLCRLLILVYLKCNQVHSTKTKV